MDKNEGAVSPENLESLSAEQLEALENEALAEFDQLAADPNIDNEGVAKLTALADRIEALRAARTTKVTAAGEDTVAAVNAVKDRVSKLKAVPAAPKADDKGDDEGESANDEGGEEPVVAGAKPRPSLAAAQARAPEVDVTAPRLDIIATSPTSNVQIGTRFENLDALVAAVQNHAKSLVTTHGTPSFLTVASIQNHFDVVADDRMSPRDFEAMIKEIRNEDAVEAIVAGGGWCAPSEIRYDFFNIACQDGTVDLPTFGVNRGGIKYPVSPSLADVFTGSFTNATNPWLWTETDDVAAVTGSPTKPCVRVPCATFDERRLECYGICLTAGNLTDSAYPEATRNYLSLLMSAHYRAMNQRYLQTMVSLSSAAVVVTGSGWGTSIASDLPDLVAVAAQDYRTRYGMCDDDVLEVIIPRWVKDAIRGDLARRSGDASYLKMSDADINGLFKLRRVRIQWVADWQVRGAGQFGQATALKGWPATVDFMIYAAGTFVRGNGLSLDLGVVRDSVLNSTNDHTAAWTEECHLIAKYGHESRIYRLPVAVGGKVGGTIESGNFTV